MGNGNLVRVLLTKYGCPELKPTPLPEEDKYIITRHSKGFDIHNFRITKDALVQVRFDDTGKETYQYVDFQYNFICSLETRLKRTEKLISLVRTTLKGLTKRG